MDLPPRRRRQSIAELRASVGPAIPSETTEQGGGFAHKEFRAAASFNTHSSAQPAASKPKSIPRPRPTPSAPRAPQDTSLTLDQLLPGWIKRNRSKLPKRSTMRTLGHLSFVAVFTGWLANTRDSEMSFIFRQLIREKFLDSEFHQRDTEVLTTFEDVGSTSAVYQFLRGPFLDGLFAEQDSRATGSFDVGWINSQARLVGAPRIRQIRVATNSCTTDLLPSLVPTCYPSLSAGTRRMAPLYGVNLGGGMRRVYRYTPALFTDLPHVALVNGYLPGGYIVNLPARRIHASAVLDMMERDGFVSIETRAIMIDFNLYNANINTFCIVRITFELLSTGAVLPFGDFRTARLLPYEGDTGELQYLLDVLVITCADTRARAMRHARALQAAPPPAGRYSAAARACVHPHPH